MITNQLKNYLAQHLKSKLVFAQVGIGGNSTSPAQETLDIPITAGITLVTSDSDDNVIEAKVSVTSGLTNSVVREMGLFDAGGDLMNRINFDGVGPFASNETLEIFLLIEVE